MTEEQQPGQGRAASLPRRIARRMRAWVRDGGRTRDDLAAELNSAYDRQLSGIAEMTPAEWDAFAAHAATLVPRMAPSDWARVEVRKKVLLGFSALGRRDLAVEFLAADGWERDHFAGAERDGTVIADVPFATEIRDHLGAHFLEFSDAELFMNAVLRTVDVSEDGVTLEVFAHVNHIRVDVEDLRVSCVLVAPNGAQRSVQIERYSDPLSAPGYTRRYADMATAAARVRIPREFLGEAGSYEVRVRIETGGLAREAALTLDASTVLSIAAPLGGHLVAMEGTGGEPLKLRVFQPEDRITSLEGSARRVRFECAIDGADPSPPAQAMLIPRGQTAAVAHASPMEMGDGRWAVELELPVREGVGPIEYVLAVQRAGEAPTFPAYVGAPAHPQPELHITSSLHRWGEPSGQTIVVDLGEALLLTAVTMTGDAIRLRVPGGVTELWEVSAGTAVTQLEANVDGEETELVFSLTEDRWGLGKTAVRPGKYVLDQNGRQCYLSGELVSAFPLRFSNALCNLTVARAADGTVVLSVTPPYRPEDIGAGQQLRMQEWARTLRPAPEGPRSIVFRNLFGEHANDSALAVHRELGNRGSSLERIWCVKDMSVWVPEGARRVLEGSREYYEAFGTANYVMVNMHQPRWHHKPPGQVIIQTFHGYQFKLQGRRWFEQLGHDERRKESLFRRADEWDYLVSPAASSTGPLRESYRSDDGIPSEVLELGYPRNDALLGPDAEQLRADTRKRLGIPDGKIAILYAPTFRDAQSSDDMTADFVDHLDEERLMRELGSEYVLLMRGHPFNARLGVDAARHVVNVTDYPDINHLILASDAAVLDYSSLRFDYALTGKPMVFFVPDLESYFATRESFWPFEETAPGPLVRLETDLIAALRDAPAVAEQYEPARRRFLADYMEHEDGHATERLVDAVFVPRGDA